MRALDGGVASLPVRHLAGSRDLDAAEHAAAVLLASLGIDVGGSLAETPARMVRAFDEMLTPRDFDLKTFPNDEGYSQLVIEREIGFRSLCEHHFLPFVGHARMSHISPANGSSGSPSWPAWSSCSRIGHRYRSV